MLTLNLTNEEFQALAGLLDAGVKQIGLRAVKEAASILGKMEAAGAATAGQAAPMNGNSDATQPLQ